MKRLIVDICGSRILPLPLNFNNFSVDFGILLPFSTLIFFVKISYSLELIFGGHTLCRWHIFIYNKIKHITIYFWIYSISLLRQYFIWSFFHVSFVSIWNIMYMTTNVFEPFQDLLSLHVRLYWMKKCCSYSEICKPTLTRYFHAIRA